MAPYGREMWRIYFSIFGSCEPLSLSPECQALVGKLKDCEYIKKQIFLSVTYLFAFIKIATFAQIWLILQFYRFLSEDIRWIK